MKKIIAISSFSICALVSSCSNETNDFCVCLEESQKLDAIANQVLLGNDTKVQTDRLMEAREAQVQACKDFELTSGEQMKEWMADCEKN